ncbi:MAG: hypothetical protein HZA62_11520 [Rhodocyclales bacterium]|nr:hypothetical protein [Rhodocyclales bacterium]
MRRLSAGLLWLCIALAGSAAAQSAADPEQQRRLAEQKLKLVEMLVNAPAAKAAAASKDGDSAALIERGRRLLVTARDALAAQHYPEAASALDEALRSVSKANSRNAGGLSDSVQKQRLQDMSEQVATYRGALVDMQKHPRTGGEATTALGRVDALAEEAKRLAAAGRLGDANKKMAESYKLAVEEISRLRAGEVVTMSLKFNSPAEEYAYEQKRFQSNEILVNMMIAEGRADGDKRRMVDGFVQDAGKLKADAISQAINNNHKEAVTAMEKAFTQLNRALQTMGVPAF